MPCLALDLRILPRHAAELRVVSIHESYKPHSTAQAHGRLERQFPSSFWPRRRRTSRCQIDQLIRRWLPSNIAGVGVVWDGMLACKPPSKDASSTGLLWGRLIPIRAAVLDQQPQASGGRAIIVGCVDGKIGSYAVDSIRADLVCYRSPFCANMHAPEHLTESHDRLI